MERFHITFGAVFLYSGRDQSWNPREPLIKSRLTAWRAICLHISRHLARKLLAGRQPSGVIFIQSDEKSDCASCTPDLISDSLGNDDALYGLPEDLARDIQEECFFPDGILCELRRYQEWGVKYILHLECVLLGDEMGLGKTVQAIAVMVSLKNTGATHFLVVCPASVITNWCREIRKTSKLTVTKVHGGTRRSAFQSWLDTGDVAVTTYETTAFCRVPEAFRFSLLVNDTYRHYLRQ